VAARKKGPKKAQERNLTRELSTLLGKILIPSLEERAKQPAVAAALTAQYEAERKANRTAEKRDEWVERTLEQVGVAWILSCIFVRTLEDRGYLSHARLAGEGSADSEHLFFDQFPSLTQRDYLLAVFRELSHVPGGEDVLGPKHNPAWRMAPSTEAVRELLTFLRETDAEGRLQWTFGGDDTRFLGDLYQDISEAVRERYALLQTPGFVEEFILDLTLDPAIAEYGLEEVRLLDPTCGSGHFLLGAFKRLFEARQRKAPGKPVKEHAFAALGQVYGVDVNPYAAAIARFRLVLAYLRAAEIDKLKNAPRLPSNVVVADSLAFFAKDQTLHFAGTVEDGALWGGERFQLEDPREATRVFGRKYHAVVGNPPYITCKDPKLRELYRKAYKSAAGKYALSAPFAERFFQLPVDGGFVGMINANSFMKRSFGKALIEKVLPQIELTHVINTARAYIPGHGTPTVLLFGRKRSPLSASVLAVLAKRGEPQIPRDPERGLVWSSIRDHFRQSGFENDFISTAEIPRETLNKHQWSLGGGGAAELKDLLEHEAETILGKFATSVGPMTILGEDEVFARPKGRWPHLSSDRAWIADFGTGEELRDWALTPGMEVFFPYRDAQLCTPDRYPHVSRLLWPYKRALLNRPDFGGKKYIDVGRTWYEFHQVPLGRLKTSLSIGFAFVATHNHFVLDRGHTVFNRSAPVVKLASDADESAHLALLAYLNSSTACFWIKQVLHDKGSGTDSGKWQPEPAKIAYEFTSAGVKGLPLPPFDVEQREALAHQASTLEGLALERNLVIARALDNAWTDLRELQAHIRAAREDDARLLGQMIAGQEVIDWISYAAFGLCPRELLSRTRAQSLALGARPFEALMAAEGHSVGLDGQTLRSSDSQGSDQAALVEAIRNSDELRLIEVPEYKRRWVTTPKHLNGRPLTFEDRVQAQAVERANSEINRIINDLSLGNRVVRERDVVDALRLKTRFLALLDGGLLPSSDLQTCVHTLASAVAAPYLAAIRYSSEGVRKYRHWQEVWSLQRLQDNGETVSVPVPEKYRPSDYANKTIESLRGKLDVPTELLISYPGAEKDDDKSPLFGWAGWDHFQQATALASLYHERKSEDGWPPDRLVPLLAGLLELLPWLKQWHNEPTDELGGEGAGDWYERYIDAEARSLGKSRDDLRDWRPAKGGRGRKK
jgi:hypothetical protein